MLDDKLIEILKGYYWAIENSIGGEPEFADEVNGDYVAQIKQAFADDAKQKLMDGSIHGVDVYETDNP